jgi:hypothetical protein
MADIFISYTNSDRDWAFWVAKELEGLGHTRISTNRRLEAATASMHGWNSATKSPTCALRPLGRLSKGPLLDPGTPCCALAGSIKAAGLRTVRGSEAVPAAKPRRCELYGVPEEAARTRFRDFMQTAAFPGEGFAVSNIPIRVPEHFLGREDSLSAINAALHR